jgi:hypothetical protein
VQTNEASTALLASKLAIAESQIHRTISGKDTAAAESLHQSWRNSLICRQVDQILSGHAIEAPNPAICSAAGNGGNLGQDALVNAELPKCLGLSNQTELPAPERTPVISAESHRGYQAHQSPIQVQSHFEKQPSTLIKGPVVRHKLPTNAWSLLEYYFAFTNAWIPIIDKQDMLKRMYSFPADGYEKKDLAAAGGYAELCSIMAVAALQMADPSESDRLSELAISLIPLDEGVLNVSHAKALLAICILHMIQEGWLAAWTFLGIAIRTLLALKTGAFRDAATSTATTQHVTAPVNVDSSLRASFVLECAVATKLHTSPHLRPDLIQSLRQIEEDGIEEWGVWNDPIGPVATIKTPVRAYSSLNKIVRAAITSFDAIECLPREGANDHNTFTPQGGAAAQSARLLPGTGNTLSQVISALLLNGQKAEGRRHPGEIVASAAEAVQMSPNDVTSVAQQPHESHIGFMSVPTGTSSDTTFASPMAANLASTNHIWDQNAASASDSYAAGDANMSGNIFEEWAELERSNSNQHPQFMQNLGFAPDLDLAEFFGADYQLSDPLLAYMQPSLFDLPPEMSTGPGTG